MKKIRVLAAALTAMLSMTWVAPALAQAAYPSKPIRFIVPYPPGGANDTLARLVAQKMTEGLGQQVIVDNRPGASGVIGLDAVAKAPADGHTLGLAINTFVINASIMSKLPYDTDKDFTPVASLASSAFLMAVNSKVPVNDLKGFVALARQKPGSLNYGTVGSAGIGRLVGEMFSMNADVQVTQIPFKGSAQLLTSLVSGDVDFVIDTANVYLPHIAEGKVRPIAVPGDARLVGLPDVPTFAELGMPKFDVRMWFGALAPAGVSPEIVKKLSAELARVMALPDVQTRLAQMEIRPFVQDSAQFGAFLKAEMAKYAEIIKTANIKPE